MDQNYTPQMPMATPGMPMQPGPSPMPTPPAPEGGTLGGDLLQQPTQEPKKSHMGLIIGIIAGVIVIAAVLIVLFAVVLPNANKGGDGSTDGGLVSVANKLTDKIKESGKNKVIYLYDDLKSLDSEINLKESSYIYYENDKPVICLTDGRHRAANIESELKNEDTAEDCVFSLTDELSKAYLESYYSDKKAKAGKTQKVNDYYVVETEEGDIYCKISHNQNKIVVTSDLDTIKSIQTVEETVDAIKYYVENILNSRVGSNQEVVDIKIMEAQDVRYVMIQNSTDYQTSLKFAEKLGKYLADHKSKDQKIGVRALVWDDSGIHNSYLIRITIADGKSSVDTLQEPINE